MKIPPVANDVGQKVVNGATQAANAATHAASTVGLGLHSLAKTVGGSVAAQVRNSQLPALFDKAASTIAAAPSPQQMKEALGKAADQATKAVSSAIATVSVVKAEDIAKACRSVRESELGQAAASAAGAAFVAARSALTAASNHVRGTDLMHPSVKESLMDAFVKTSVLMEKSARAFQETRDATPPIDLAATTASIVLNAWGLVYLDLPRLGLKGVMNAQALANTAKKTLQNTPADEALPDLAKVRDGLSMIRIMSLETRVPQLGDVLNAAKSVLRAVLAARSTVAEASAKVDDLADGWQMMSENLLGTGPLGGHGANDGDATNRLDVKTLALADPWKEAAGGNPRPPTETAESASGDPQSPEPQRQQ